MENKEKYFMIGTMALAFVAIFISLVPILKVEQSDNNSLQLEPIQYFCKETETSKSCDSLSQVNKKGTQTRCYFYSEELERLTWKVCNSGWRI